MQVFLMQHGRALAAEVDPDRPLSDEGRAEVVAVAAYAARLGITVPLLWHSDKTRAVQTAQILGEALGSGQIRLMAGLTPSADPAAVADQLRRLPADARLGIVSHLPILQRLTGLLMCGDPHTELVAFRNAGLIRLVGDQPGRFQLAWILTPELVAG